MRGSSVRGGVVVVGVGLVLASAPPASAQKAGRSESPPASAPAALQRGEYSTDSDRVVEAAARGEGPQALAYFERVAAQAGRQSQRLLLLLREKN